jgi:arginine/lysine/ornithine decarboxylase
VVEFCDKDFVTLMPSAYNTESDFCRVEQAFLDIEKRAPILTGAPKPLLLKRALPMKEAAFMPKEEIDVKQANGRILAALGVSCPPAVPIALIGEIIDKNAIEAFEYYGINKVFVNK